MKLPAIANLLTFCAIAAAITFAVVSISTREQRVADEVNHCLSDINRLQARLCQDLIIFTTTELIDHDRLGKDLEDVRHNSIKLKQLMAQQISSSSKLLAPCEEVTDQALRLCDFIERLRSQFTVLKNATSNLQGLLVQLDIPDTASQELLTEIAKVRHLLSELRPLDNQRTCSALQTSANAISERISDLNSAQVVELRRIRAQINKIVATAQFVDSDIKALVTVSQSKVIDSANRVVLSLSRDQVLSTQRMISLLAVASTSLVAFVCAGIWQFRSQAVELASLNKGLEAHVRKRTEQLNASREFLSLVLDSLPSHICILNEQGKIIQTNAAWKDFSINCNSEKIGVGMNYIQTCRVATGECRESSWHLADAIESIISAGDGKYVDEYAFDTPTGVEWYHVSVTPLEGSSVGSVVISHSCITRRVQVEQELQKQKEEAERLALVAKYTDNAVIITDDKACIEWINEGFTRLTGYTLPEVRGLIPGRFLHGSETDPKTIEHMRSCIQQKKGFDVEIVNYNKAGDHYWLSIEVRPICNEEGKIVKYIAIESDITQRKQNEAERDRLLKETQDQKTLLDAVMSSVSDGIIAANEDGQFLCFNRGAERILDKTAPDKTELENWSSAFGLFELDGNTPLTLKNLPMYRAIHGDSITNHEMIVRRENGDVAISANATPLDSTTFHGGVVTFRDVTEYKRLEQQLSQAQKLESIGQLSAGIAHEINTPMQFLSDNIEFLNESAERLFKVVDCYREFLNGSTPMSWKQRKEEIEKISKECRFEHIRAQVPGAIVECREGIDRTVRILKAMKDFSHPGTKSMTTVDLNEAIESTIAISRNRWKYVSRLELDLAPDLPQATMYIAEINQVLLNLVVNAADAIAECYPEGELGQIIVRTQKLDDYIHVEVEDNGCGMPDHVKAKIFDPFFTTKDVGKGTGQGLSITHNVVVNMHGGSIKVETEQGKGTKFSLLLPVEPLNQDEPKSEIDSLETTSTL